MATRRSPSRPMSKTRKAAGKKRPPTASPRQISALLGGILIALALLWFIWLLLRHINPGLNSLTFQFPGVGILSGNSAPVQDDALTAAGIKLDTPARGQEPSLTKQQALLLGDQMEPQAASSAGGNQTQYALFSYTHGSSTFHEVPVWLIHYTKISEPAPDTAADPQDKTGHHDFYVFLDANSGKELLTIWL